MEDVTDEEADLLDSLRQELEDQNTDAPEGFEQDDDGEFNFEDLDFENNDYFCFDGDTGWRRITFANIKNSGLPFLWNGHAFGLQKKYIFRFENECDAVYVLRKSN